MHENTQEEYDTIVEVNRKLVAEVERLRELIRTEVQCGGSRGGCLMCGRMVECAVGCWVDEEVERTHP